MKKLLFCAVAALALVSCGQKNPVLTIEGGQVQGVFGETKGVYIYKGIPYAAAPIGDLRWKEPQPVVAQSEVQEEKIVLLRKSSAARRVSLLPTQMAVHCNQSKGSKKALYRITINSTISKQLKDGKLLFSVTDNGRGFDPDTRPGVAQGHFGLQGVRERVGGLNGRFTIESAPGKGAKVTVSITAGGDGERKES